MPLIYKSKQLQEDFIMAIPHAFALGATLIILKGAATYLFAAKNKEGLIERIDWLSKKIADSPLDGSNKVKVIQFLGLCKKKLPDDDFDFDAMKKEIADEMKELSDVFDEALKKGTKAFSSVFDKILKDDNSDDK